MITAIAVSLQNKAMYPKIKDTPIISVPVPTTFPYLGISSSFTFRLLYECIVLILPLMFVMPSTEINNPKINNVADGLFCREIDGLFCRSSPDIIVRRRCVLSHKRRGWLQPSPSFRYSRNLALQDELYHPVINNGPAVLVCVDKRLGTGPVNQSRDAG